MGEAHIADSCCVASFKQLLLCRALAGQPLRPLLLTGHMLQRWLFSLSINCILSSRPVYLIAAARGCALVNCPSNSPDSGAEVRGGLGAQGTDLDLW